VSRDRDFPSEKPEKLRSSGPSDWLVQPGIGYRLTFPEIQTRLDLTRLKLEDGQTKGLLTVRVWFRGARTLTDGIVSCAEFNCAVQRGRVERANHLRERTQAADLDWPGLIEELCLRVLEAEENVELESLLWQVPIHAEESHDESAGGLPLLKRNPTIWFGDGGAGKSYLALYAAVDLAQRGHRVLYCDWEFSGEDHRHRLHRLVGPVTDIPLWYVRCDRPFVREVARLQAIVAKRQIQMLICDSVGFAALGAPEAAEAATGYFQALRALGPLTSLHLAHVNKSEQGDQKPFGSNFWHNGAKSTWYLKRSDDGPCEDAMTVGFYHRKTNTGRRRPAFGVRMEFVGTETRIRPVELDEPELAAKTPLWQRLEHTVKRMAQPTKTIADTLEVSEASIRTTVARFPQKFLRLQDGRIGLNGSA
jgi:AAA domain